MGKQTRSQQGDEFFDRDACLAKDRAERAAIKRFMIGNDNLCERLLPPKDDMASALTFELKTLFRERGNALAP